MEQETRGHFLSLTDAAQEIGLKRSGLWKRLKKDNFPMEKGVSGELEINASMFHGKYGDEIAAYKNRVSITVSKNDNGNNGKRQDIEVLREQIQGLEKVNFEQSQRLAEQNRLHEKIVAGKDETIQALRLLTDQRAEQARQLPPETVQELADLKAKAEALEKELARRDRAVAEAKAKREQEAAARAAVPLWKKILGWFFPAG